MVLTNISQNIGDGLSMGGDVQRNDGYVRNPYILSTVDLRTGMSFPTSV